MNRDQESGRSPSPWSNGQSRGQPLGLSVDPRNGKAPSQSTNTASSPYSAPPTSATRLPDRPQIPTRSSTVGSTEPDRNTAPKESRPTARSEDLNHSSSSRPVPGFLRTSRSSTPAGSSSSRPHPPSSSGHSDDSTNYTNEKRRSVASFSSARSSSSTSERAPPPSSSASSTTTSSTMVTVSATCSSCGKVMQGPFVRALGTVFHLNCFKCMDCGDVVASKFFPIEGPEGKQQPLCERDYFRRLNLICAQCGMALRGSYITACNKKYHVEHFTCSLCPTLFGPQDSYYEHDGDVYCHFHYSTRFATKCAGCNSAILKQFVEINRNMRDECWHPECYMINKFWNVKVTSRRPNSTVSLDGEEAYIEEEQRETPTSLKDKQIRMEQQVYRIWTVLSAFEESSAACISDMLRQVSNGQYLEAIRMAEKFILHVEVLFATIDDLEHQFARLNMKGMSHVREARMLCRKTVELFTLLSHTQETGTRRMGMTQELLALVTGLAHYLKILIRIALTGALKLEREGSVREAMSSFLDKLHLLAVQGGNPSARRVIKGHNGEALAVVNGGGNAGTQGVTYGFRSLAPENAGESPFSTSGSGGSGMGPGPLNSNHPPSDLCVKCSQTVEEDCVRLGTYQRWHSQCVQCAKCGRVAAVPVLKERSNTVDEKQLESAKEGQPKLSTARRPPANVGLFVYEVDSKKDTPSFGEVPTVILCTEHAHAGCRGGFQAVQRLEQYAFLLNVALRRLYLLLKRQGVVPLSPETATNSSSGKSGEIDPYRNSADIMRMKSVHLDRKLSATARLPKRSTIVESPAGRSVHPSDVLSSQKSQDVHAHSHPHHSHTHTQGPQHGQVSSPAQGRSPPQTYQAPPSLPANNNRLHVGHSPTDAQGQILRPAFARNNTEVMIVDESAPNSPAQGDEAGNMQDHIPTRDDGITLADIPQLMEAAQAREQQRSLPRQSSIPYIAELSALELAIVKHSAVLALIRSPLKDHIDLDELLEMVEMKKSGFWNKLFKGDKKNVKKKGVFGVPLELLVQGEGSDSLLGASRATLRVPSFIDDVISAMRQMDMSVEGIFRKNGNIRRLKELTEAIDKDPSSVDLTTDNPVQLAALLKKFLRDLPDPLMTYKLHKLLVVSQSLPNEADRKRLLHMLSVIMPKSHRDTMEVLFVFLKWVASFAHMDAETGSKMDLSNLATVICPSILYSRGRDAVRDESFGAIRVVTALLENQDEFFTVPQEFLPILHDQEYFANSMELPGKDFMKKCDTYQRVKAVNGRTPALVYNIPNGSTPRFPQPTSPTSQERPNLGLSMPQNGARPHPGGMPMSNSTYPSNSPSLPPFQGQGAMQNPQRNQEQVDDWANTPRPINAPPRPGSRPSSFTQARPSADQPSFVPPTGYPSAVRQRT
ncbi:LIM domain-containing protein [Armillaria fumosa]|nr:LIM domain-containing protein [Armillaria fumosa]